MISLVYEEHPPVGILLHTIGIALWMSGVSHQLGSIVFVIGLVGLVIAWVIR